MSKQLTAKQVKLSPAQVVRGSETPLAVGTCKAYTCKASVTLSDWNGKVVYIMRFDSTSAELHTHMQGAGWRFLDKRDAWWAPATPDQAKFVLELTAMQVSKHAVAPAPKAATPAAKPAKTPAKPQEQPATPAPAPAPAKTKPAGKAAPAKPATPAPAPVTVAPPVASDKSATRDALVQAYLRKQASNLAILLDALSKLE